jgi:hypothetical protein
MKKALCLSSIASCIAFVTPGLAQEAPLSPANAPPPHVGFQLGLRTGYQVPMGNANGGPNGQMSNFFAGQVPIFIELGGKPIPNLFVGGYLGLGFGGAAGDFDAGCKSANLNCATLSVRLGAEILYYILPGETADPWLGYGIGFESSGITMSNGSQSYSATDTGFEFAHLMGGIDFRVSRVFGIGPFVDFSVGQYSRYHAELPTGTEDGDIQNTATHEWIAFGARGVFFP